MEPERNPPTLYRSSGEITLSPNVFGFPSRDQNLPKLLINSPTKLRETGTSGHNIFGLEVFCPEEICP
jgi:hypothetical protein